MVGPGGLAHSHLLLSSIASRLARRELCRDLSCARELESENAVALVTLANGFCLNSYAPGLCDFAAGNFKLEDSLKFARSIRVRADLQAIKTQLVVYESM